jgi:outer membrane lipoprotein carrier protein
MRAWCGVGIAFVAACSLSFSQAPPSAAELAARIQAHYAAVRDFTAGFTLEQTDAISPRAANDRGDVKVKKPGRMRWTWTTGNKQQWVADGSQLYVYFPQDKYCTITPLPKPNEASPAILFLIGHGDLTRDFTASLPGAQPADEWHVTLTPKTPQSDFTTLLVEVDRATWQLRGLQIADSQGGLSKYRFQNLRENQNQPDSDFAFSPPRGVEIRR